MKGEGALAAVMLAYVLVALGRPIDVFWSPDQGGKFLQVQALLDGRHDLSIPYLGRDLDPGLAFHPYTLARARDGLLQFPWPMIWIAPTAFLYRALGPAGLVVLPLLGGALAAWAAGRLADRVFAGSGWTAVVISGLATPMLIYSTLFWEHAPAAGLFTFGLLLLLTERSTSSGPELALAGCCFGLAVALRAETIIFLVAVVLALTVVRRTVLQWRRMIWLSGGFLLVMVPTALMNWRLIGLVYSRTDALPRSIEGVGRNLALYLPDLPASFLAGSHQYGLNLPEPARWAPAIGLLLLGASLLPRITPKRWLLVGGLVLSGAGSVALLMVPSPQSLQGALLPAPFLSLILVRPGHLAESATGRALLVLASIALPLYIAAALLTHVRGLDGGAGWGPRYLLAIYPALAALAAATLCRLEREGRRVELALGRGLVVLGVLVQLAGLARMDLTVQRYREDGELLANLPSGPIVTRGGAIAQLVPALAQQRELFCAASSADFRRWSELAINAGRRDVWFVDRQGIPTNWLAPGSMPPLALGEAAGGQLRAGRYDIAAVLATLRSDTSARVSCEDAERG